MNWYLDRVHKAASTERRVCSAFFDVANLLKSATALFQPGIVARVAKECVLSRAPEARSKSSRDTNRSRMAETS